MSFSIESTGSFKNLETFLQRMLRQEMFKSLAQYGDEGVRALASATPKDTANTASQWYYEIKDTKGTYSITWSNRNVVDGVPVVILLQYGHGTGTGGYVKGQDFINPAIQPIFDKISQAVWKEVTKG